VPLVPGARLGPYEILALIGKGGMGEVYLARDPRLDRNVAVKVLPVTVAADFHSIRRFEQEARAVAALQHPHICAVYDVGRQDDVSFFVMEFLHGATLKDHLADHGPLPVPQLLEYSIQIADALAEAHQAAIIHRDLKPSNVVITRAGVKLLDFGIAKIPELAAVGDALSTESTLTAFGRFVGTLQYMSPEQLRGQPVDVRSDLFAFGAVVYEMATGVAAFAAPDQASAIAAILNRNPAGLLAVMPSVPERFSNAVAKCLSKDRAERWVSAQAVADELRSIARSPRRRARHAHASHAQRSSLRSLAVLPLEDFSADGSQPFFSDGITEALTSTLAGFKGVRVISRTSALRYKGSRKPLSQIARELNVDGVLEGSILRSGNRVRLSVQLIDASTDAHLWTGTFDRERDDVLALQDEFAHAVAREIRLKVPSSTDPSARAARKLEPAAHEAYLRGRYLLERETLHSLKQSFQYLNEAASVDSGFAPTFVALAQWYMTACIHGLVQREEASERAQAAAETAIRLNPTLAAAHALRAEVLFVQWRFDEAERGFRKAAAIGPNDAWSIGRLGRYLMVVGKTREAVRVMASAERLDPLSPATLASVATTLYADRQFDAAITGFDKALELQADSPRVLSQQALAYVLSGRPAEALACLERAMKNPDITPYSHSALTAARIYAYARAGRRSTAVALLSELEANAAEPTHVAEALTGLGEGSRAVAYLHKAAAAGGLTPLGAKCDPLYDEIRPLPEFQAFLRRIGLPD
jgi:eukaryotic-like serine/threonine-protein kinase